MTPLPIGSRVVIATTTEPLILVCVDMGRAWVRDDVGNHLEVPEVDLKLHHSEEWHAARAERRAA